MIVTVSFNAMCANSKPMLGNLLIVIVTEGLVEIELTAVTEN